MNRMMRVPQNTFAQMYAYTLMRTLNWKTAVKKRLPNHFATALIRLQEQDETDLHVSGTGFHPFIQVQQLCQGVSALRTSSTD